MDLEVKQFMFMLLKICSFGDLRMRLSTSPPDLEKRKLTHLFVSVNCFKVMIRLKDSFQSLHDCICVTKNTN